MPHGLSQIQALILEVKRFLKTTMATGWKHLETTR
jgi:hypothetical protein